MAEHLMLVVSNAKPDREQEFNDWYSGKHVLDVLEKLEGFATAQRFVLADEQVEGGCPHRYLALYRIPEGRLADAQEWIRYQRTERAPAESEGRDPLVDVAEVFDGPTHSWFFTAITDELTSSRTPRR